MGKRGAGREVWVEISLRGGAFQPPIEKRWGGASGEGRIEVYEQEISMDGNRTGDGCGFCEQSLAAGVYGLVLKECAMPGLGSG